jgi:hypothetical protein
MADAKHPRPETAAPIAAVKVIGLGGIGAQVAQAMAQFLSSRRVCKTLVLIDGDAYEEDNRDRVVFTECENKAVVKARELGRAAPERLTVLPVPSYVTPRNARRLIGEGEVVFVCVDNHASRKVVADRCRRLDDIVLVSGGNDGVEDGRAGTFGNTQIHVRRGGRDVTNPLTRFHPELARPRDRRPDQRDCAELVQSAPQLLFTNLAVAASMLSAFYAWWAGSLDFEEVYLDIALGQATPVKRAVSTARRTARA